MVKIGKYKNFTLEGEVAKVRKWEKVAMFDLKTKGGYIPCKTFCKEIIDMLVEEQELIVSSFNIKRNKWIDKNGIAKYETDIIVNEITIDNVKEAPEYVSLDDEEQEYVIIDKTQVAQEIEDILNDD